MWHLVVLFYCDQHLCSNPAVWSASVRWTEHLGSERLTNTLIPLGTKLERNLPFEKQLGDFFKLFLFVTDPETHLNLELQHLYSAAARDTTRCSFKARRLRVLQVSLDLYLRIQDSVWCLLRGQVRAGSIRSEWNMKTSWEGVASLCVTLFYTWDQPLQPESGSVISWCFGRASDKRIQKSKPTRSLLVNTIFNTSETGVKYVNYMLKTLKCGRCHDHNKRN